MNYWKAKSDRAFMETFQSQAAAMWDVEDEYAARRGQPRFVGQPARASDDQRYQEARAELARGMTHAQAIASRVNVGPSMSYLLVKGTQRQDLRDLLNKVVGACEDEVAAERRHLKNPMWWLLYGPFVLLQSAGIDTAKFEKTWWSRAIVQITFGVITGLIVWGILAAFGVS